MSAFRPKADIRPFSKYALDRYDASSLASGRVQCSRKSPAFHLKEKHWPLARTARRSMSLLALGLLLCLGTGSKQAQTPNQNESLFALLVIELTAMVAQHGWVANLGSMCPAMRIGAEADCRFQTDLSKREHSCTIDNHGFNVQLHKSRQRVGNHYFPSRGARWKFLRPVPSRRA